MKLRNGNKVPEYDLTYLRLALKQGDYVSARIHGYVEAIQSDHIIVRDTSGAAHTVHESQFRQYRSASLSVETIRVSRTEMAEILMQSRGDVFTVTFHRKLDTQSLSELLFEALKREGGQFMSYEHIREQVHETVNEITAGSRRVLIGQLVRPEPIFGRSLVVDLESTVHEQHAFRYVDHRSLVSLIWAGIEYRLK